jgi:prophage regulatory protein
MPPKVPQPENPQRRTEGIAREAERREITGVPQSTWRVMQDKGLAPKPVRLGPRSVGWLRAELLAWVEDRVADRDGWQTVGNVAKCVIGKLGRP